MPETTHGSSMVAFPRSRSIFGAEAEALASDAPIQIVHWLREACFMAGCGQMFWNNQGRNQGMAVSGCKLEIHEIRLTKESLAPHSNEFIIAIAI